MKKLMSLLCCTMLVFALAGCGSSGTGAQGTAAAKGEDAAEETTTAARGQSESVYYDKLGNILPEALEIVYNDVREVRYRGGWKHMFVFAGVKNVSDVMISPGMLNAYALKKEDGTVVEEKTYFSWVSKKVVNPGETVYLYDYYSIEGVEKEEKIVCEPLFGDILLHKDEYHNWDLHEVSNLKVSDAGDDGDHLQLTGVLHCKDVKEGQDIHLVAFGYDKSGKPACVFTELIKDGEPGKDIEFTMMAEVYQSVTPNDLAEITEVQAYSYVGLN